MERDARVLSHGQSEDWGSDTSAEFGPGMSSPRSARTRQQSITTAATSVDAQFMAGGRGQGTAGCESVPCSPEKPPRFAGDGTESWVDLAPEMLRAEEAVRREMESQKTFEELHRPRTAPSTGFPMEGDGMEQTQQNAILVPQRRSSLSHHAATVILGETAHSRKRPTHKISSELASQLRLAPSSRSLPHQLSAVPAATHHNWEEQAPAWAPVVPTDRRQPRNNVSNEVPEAFLSSEEEVPHQLFAQRNAQIDSLEPLLPSPCQLPGSELHPRDFQVDSPETVPPGQLFCHGEPQDLQIDSIASFSLSSKQPFDYGAPRHKVQDDSTEVFKTPSDQFPGHLAARQKAQPNSPEMFTVPPELLPYRRVPRQNLRLDLPEAFPVPPNPLSCHQLPQNPQHDLLQTQAFDQLSLPPLSTQETNHYDALSTHRSDHQHSISPFKPRKSQNVNRVPLLNNIQNWLESSSNAQQFPSPTLSPTSPAMSPTSGKIRIPGPVLENLNAMVKGFPETMLSTDTLAVQMVRDYSRMVKRDHISQGNAGNASTFVESPNTPLQAQSHSQPQPQSQSRALGRKTSLANLNFVSSLRGKFGGRLASSVTAPDLRNFSQFQDSPSHDGNSVCATLPDKKKTDGCVISLRTMFPNGTDYLLDALYANILVYNYVHSVCGGLATLPQNGADANLRGRPSKNFALPSGVTSLADLELQPDSSDTVLQDWQDDIATVASRPVVPTKAASLLGIGDTYMGRPLPTTGSRLGRPPKPRKVTPCSGPSVRANSSSSDAVMAELRDDIAHNIYRLVETMKTCSPDAEDKAGEEDDGGVVASTKGSQLDPTLMRSLCEVVRCYEEITALRGGA